MYQYLTRILLCSLLMLCATGAKGQSSTLPFNELNEVINLYCDGQYNIVKAKLGNLGFIVTKSTPDYSLDGVTHSGDFVMMREKTSSIEAFRMHGFKDVDRFFFSTVIRHSQVSGYVHTRTMDISFNYSEAGAVGVYDTYKRFWNGNIDTITCQKYSHNKQCSKLFREEKRKIRNPSKDVGLQNALIYNTLFLEMDNTPIETIGFSSTPREFITGTLTRNIHFASTDKSVKVISGSHKKK